MRHKSRIKASRIISVLQAEDLLVSSHRVNAGEEYNKLESDSRLIEPGDVFACIRGLVTDGHSHAEKAHKNGAALFIAEKHLPWDFPQIIVKNSRRATAVLAKLFFADPTSEFSLIGITGTNGKTTIAGLTAAILRQSGKRTGLIGTLGYDIDGKHYASERTTPDIIDLNRMFRKMADEKAEFVVMEVSSHALALERVYGLHFEVALFSNLSQDHLDFHVDMNDYAQAKFKLFQQSRISIINLDDETGRNFFRKIESTKFGLSFQDADFSIRNCSLEIDGSSFQLVYRNNCEQPELKKAEKPVSPFSSLTIKTKLIGRFNIFNAAAAATIVQLAAPDIPGTQLERSIAACSPLPGRLQSVPNSKNIGIYVDYAHTPDALANVLEALSQFKRRRLICVFGAGGDRDRTKRPQMLQVALKYADLCLLTNDNPRREATDDIIRDIVADASSFENFWIIRNRKTAIQTAIRAARENDIVLLAGKGHETYQEIDGIRYPFDDAEEAAQALTDSEQTGFLAFPIDALMLHLLFEQETKCRQPEKQLRHISTDSRLLQPDSLFFALSGANFDGHDYVGQVLKNDNCLAVVRRDYPAAHPALIRVDDTLAAYGLLAEKYRSLFKINKIAITGSAGKTTTKEYLANILAQKFNILKTSANENNLIGLPKTIFNLKPEHDIAILELGTNQFGEIARLTAISQPDFALITFVGPCHLEFLIDEDGVFREKTALFQPPNVIRFFPGDDPRFSSFKGISFGKSLNCTYRIEHIRKVNGKTEFTVNNIRYSIPTPFATFALNALNAIAISSELHLDPETIQNGLNKPLQIEQRMEIKTSGKRTLLVDCYNANPDSMRTAIEFWLQFEPARPHIAILGDMLELGRLTEKYHENIWQLLRGKEIELLISVGSLSRIYDANSHFDKVEQLIESQIYKSFAEEAIILIKASHSIHLEKIIGRL